MGRPTYADVRDFVTNVFESFLLKHADMPWNWYKLSEKGMISKTLLRELNDKPWDWNHIARFPEFAPVDLTGKRKRAQSLTLPGKPRTVRCIRMPRRHAPCRFCRLCRLCLLWNFRCESVIEKEIEGLSLLLDVITTNRTSICGRSQSPGYSVGLGFYLRTLFNHTELRGAPRSSLELC